MSFCIKPSHCKKCGKPLTMFEGWTCLECEKAEQEPYIDTTSGEKEPCDECIFEEGSKYCVEHCPYEATEVEK